MNCARTYYSTTLNERETVRYRRWPRYKCADLLTAVGINVRCSHQFPQGNASTDFKTKTASSSRRTSEAVDTRCRSSSALQAKTHKNPAGHFSSPSQVYRWPSFSSAIRAAEPRPFLALGWLCPTSAHGLCLAKESRASDLLWMCAAREIVTA